MADEDLCSLSATELVRAIRAEEICPVEVGHAQMRTTTDTYSHVMPALGKDAAERMGRALWD